MKPTIPQMMALFAVYSAVFVHAILFEQWTEASSLTWTNQGKPEPVTTINLRIALAIPNSALFEERAIDIATPGHNFYRKHMTPDEIASWFQPPSDAVVKVTHWLEGHGIQAAFQSDLVVADNVPLTNVETLLNASYNIYTRDGQVAIRTEKYYVPEELHALIDFIAPTVHMPSLPLRNYVPETMDLPEVLLSEAGTSPNPEDSLREGAESIASTLSASSLESICGPTGSLTRPNCTRALYGITYQASNANTTFGINNAGGGFDEAFLEKYLKVYNPPAYKAKATFKLVAITAQDQNTDIEGAETAYDTQLSLGLAWPAQGLFYLNSNDNSFSLQPRNSSAYQSTEDHYLTYLHQLTYNETVAPVISESSALNELEVPNSYALRLCRMYAQIGARGVTLLYSSGDNGPQGTNMFLPRTKTVEAGFPGACPFITSVGGTTNPLDEISATYKSAEYASSGGFSVYFSRPAYQNASVSSYIENYIPAAFYNVSGFHPSGRGFPDISALSANLAVYDESGGNKTFHKGGGTSTSSPQWAAFIALLNDYEANHGRPPLGFLNPWLYSLEPGKGLRDITHGGANAGLGGYYPNKPVPEGTPNDGGYVTAPGWDPVTGLGVPDFPKLLEDLDAREGT